MDTTYPFSDTVTVRRRRATRPAPEDGSAQNDAALRGAARARPAQVSCTPKAAAFPLYIRVPGWASKVRAAAIARLVPVLASNLTRHRSKHGPLSRCGTST